MARPVKGFVLGAALALATAFTAQAESIKVGVTISQTGPAASLGIPQRNSVALLPTEIAGQKIEYILLDDATDSTKAVANTRKLIDEDNIDVLIGPSITPAALAMIDIVGEKKVPMIALAASAKIIEPQSGARQWVFKTPQNDSLMADAVAGHMAQAGIKSVAFIGFHDAYGDGWLAEITRALGEKGIKSLDDLADLAGDEWLEIVGETAMDEDVANDIIMIARAHWFADAAGEGAGEGDVAVEAEGEIADGEADHV